MKKRIIIQLVLSTLIASVFIITGCRDKSQESLEAIEPVEFVPYTYDPVDSFDINGTSDDGCEFSCTYVFDGLTANIDYCITCDNESLDGSFAYDLTQKQYDMLQVIYQSRDICDGTMDEDEYTNTVGEGLTYIAYAWDDGLIEDAETLLNSTYQLVDYCIENGCE